MILRKILNKKDKTFLQPCILCKTISQI